MISAFRQTIKLSRQIALGVAATTLFVDAARSNSLNAQEREMTGKITSVTVYRSQARVTREIQIPASPEVQNIRVIALPSELVPNSTFTESDAKTSVRSLRIQIQSRNKSEATGGDDGLVELRNEAEQLQSKLNSATHSSRVIEQDLLTLEQLVDFSAAKVGQNLDRATLDVQSVTALADFAMQRRRALAEELYKTKTEIEALTAAAQKNSEQQREKISASTKTGYEARLAIDSPGGGTVRLSYEVGGVSWTPRYTVRSQKGESKDREFRLQLDAAVVQNSGESWSDVKVALATSSPNTQASRPLLTPLRIESVANDNLNADIGTTALTHSDPTDDFNADLEWLDARVGQRDLSLNTKAGLRQVDELTQAGQTQRQISNDAGANVADETYVVSRAISLENHPQIQSIAILSQALRGEMHHVVTPLLSSYGFREAKLTNTSGQNLVAGSADVYLDGRFAGRITLPPTAQGQQFVIGFGHDRQVRTRRELLARKESIQGGNRRSELKYRLVVANYHENAIDIQLLDRIPIAAKDGSINISLDAADVSKVSVDPLYVRMQRPTGVLRWDLKIPPRRFGSDAYDHEYQYMIELDRQQTIVGDDLVRRMRDDLRFKKTNGGGGMGGGLF